MSQLRTLTGAFSDFISIPRNPQAVLLCSSDSQSKWTTWQHHLQEIARPLSRLWPQGRSQGCCKGELCPPGCSEGRADLLEVSSGAGETLRVVAGSWLLTPVAPEWKDAGLRQQETLRRARPAPASLRASSLLSRPASRGRIRPVGSVGPVPNGDWARQKYREGREPGSSDKEAIKTKRLKYDSTYIKDIQAN